MNNNTPIARPPKMTEINTQVLVLGGGLPGVCAAIQAAECGLAVTLVERGMTLGGNCGPELGVHPSDGHRFHTYMCSTGLVGRLIEDAAFVFAKTESYDGHYNVSMRWDTVMSDALDKAGVTVLRSHYAHTPYMLGDKIVAVECEDTLTYNRVKINVSDFVIDDTGDGNISERAGAVYRMGREASSEFGERFAPEKADNVTMGASLTSLIRKTWKERPFVPSENMPSFYPGYGGVPHARHVDGVTMTFWYPTETGGDLDTIQDGHKIYQRLRGHLDSAWDQVKNGEHRDVAEDWEMFWVSAKMGKRESRRFEGDYILNENDVEEGRIFEDAIAVGGFAVDVHDPKAENPEYVHVKYYLIPPTYTVPYRCVYSKNIDNLFFASRLLSASHMAHGTVRVQRTLATIGQAVGLAAYLCKKHDVSPRELYTQGHIKELQQLLLKDGATLLGAVNEDPADLARIAVASADSEIPYGVRGEVLFAPVSRVAGAELWDFGDRIESCRILVRNTTEEQVFAKCTLRRFSPERKWLRRGEREFFDYQARRNEAEWGSEHRVKYFPVIAETEVIIPAGFEGYVEVPFNASCSAKDPYNDDDRMMVVLETDAQGLEVGQSHSFAPYMRSLQGYGETAEGEQKYVVKPWCSFVEIKPTPCYGEAGQVINGSNRRFSENPINMWRPEKLPATLELSWESAVCGKEIRIVFDTLARTAMEMPYESGRKASPQCAKAFRLHLEREGAEVYSCRYDEWYHRLAVVHIPNVEFDRLKLTVEETWAADQLPGIYEVRVY